MAIVGSRVTITTAITKVFDPNRHGSASSSITGSVLNLGPSDVDLGGADVVAGAGYPLTVGSAIDLDLIAYDILYAVTTSGTAVLALLKMRQ